MRTGFEAIQQEAFYYEYLRRLDAQALLDHYGAENQREERNKDGTPEIIHSCLIDRVDPHHSNGDANPSAACNLEKKKYICYSGGWQGDLFHLVMKMEGLTTFSESLGLVRNYLTGATLDDRSFAHEIEKIFASGAAYSVNLPTYDLKIIESWNRPHPYWEQRGINQHAIDSLMLGYDERHRRITFPHFVNNVLVGWQKRVIPGETTEFLDQKYKNSPGFPKSETLYNLDIARKYPRVCVVESPMSVAKALSYDLPNVVSTFGAKVGQGQIDLLADFEMVYIWFDRDKAGIQGERKLIEGLWKKTTVKVITPDRGKDMGDATLEEIVQKIGAAEPAAIRLGAHDLYRRMRRR